VLVVAREGAYPAAPRHGFGWRVLVGGLRGCARVALALGGRCAGAGRRARLIGGGEGVGAARAASASAMWAAA
jgi:hypothetical protein